MATSTANCSRTFGRSSPLPPIDKFLGSPYLCYPLPVYLLAILAGHLCLVSHLGAVPVVIIKIQHPTFILLLQTSSWHATSVKPLRQLPGRSQPLLPLMSPWALLPIDFNNSHFHLPFPSNSSSPDNSWQFASATLYDKFLASRYLCHSTHHGDSLVSGSISPHRLPTLSNTLSCQLGLRNQDKL